jgi:hypothetical protein
MIRAKTVLVLGAGANVSVGFPLGAGLVTDIADRLIYRFEHRTDIPSRGDKGLYNAIRLLPGADDYPTLNRYLNAAGRIAISARQAISIDNVIHMLESEDTDAVGKLAISHAILNAEHESPSFRGSERTRSDMLDVGRFAQSWHSQFLKLVTEDVQRSKANTIFENLSVINFNYDRSFEQYLGFALAEYFGIELSTARAIVDSLPVYRPYGRVGRLPWQKGEDRAVNFGATDETAIFDGAKNLKTFTEQVDEGDVIKQMRTAIRGARRVIFLGFAFYRQNVRLLTQSTDNRATIMGTAFGVSGSDREHIKSELESAFRYVPNGAAGYIGDPAVKLLNGKCEDFFTEYGRTLTAA